MRSLTRSRLAGSLLICALASLLGACVSRPALSLELDGATIYADTEPELAFASRIYESFPASIPPELELDFSIPARVQVFSSTPIGPAEEYGMTTKFPVVETRRVRVYGPAWPSWLGHELFHVYSLEALEGVPQIIQEGLADWYGTPASTGYSEVRLSRWKELLDQRPQGYLNVEFDSATDGPSSTRLIGLRPTFDRADWPSVEQLVALDTEGFNALDHDQKAMAHTIGFALVECLASEHPERLSAHVLKRGTDESPAEYLRRLDLPDSETLRRRAIVVVGSSSPTRVHWLTLRKRISALLLEVGRHFESERDLRAGLKVAFEADRQRFDLLQDPDFQRLLSEHCFLYFGAAE